MCVSYVYTNECSNTDDLMWVQNLDGLFLFVKESVQLDILPYLKEEDSRGAVNPLLPATIGLF